MYFNILMKIYLLLYVRSTVKITMENNIKVTWKYFNNADIYYILIGEILLFSQKHCSNDILYHR